MLGDINVMIMDDLFDSKLVSSFVVPKISPHMVTTYKLQLRTIFRRETVRYELNKLSKVIWSLTLINVPNWIFTARSSRNRLFLSFNFMYKIHIFKNREYNFCKKKKGNIIKLR